MQRVKLRTPWKTRVVLAHEVGDKLIFLLVHPSGELLLVSNTDNCGAARWDRACILWIAECEEYWMCKYGAHDKKFSLAGLDEKQLSNLSEYFGIEFRPNGKRSTGSSQILDSVAARSLLNWIKKHPRMARENPTVAMYNDILLENGTLPLPPNEYTGF